MARRKSAKKIPPRSVFAVYDATDNTGGVIDGDNITRIDDGYALRDYLVDLIETNRATTTVWLYGLSLLIEDIIKTLYHMGFNDVTGAGLKLKEFKALNYDYAVSTAGICYRLRIKGHGDKIISFYDPVNLLGKRLDNITKDFYAGDSDKWHKQAQAVKNGVLSLITKGKRTPYTISMIAVRKWRDIEGITWNDFNFIDAHGLYMGVDKDGKHTTLDEYLRPAYKGGYNYLSDLGKKYTGGGIVLDVNSLYPWVMANYDIPCGPPVRFEKEIPQEALQPRHYYFVHVKCSFDINPGYLPYIGIHDWAHAWGAPLESSDFVDRTGKIHKYYIDKNGDKKRITVELTLTQTDWEILQEAYMVENIEIIDGVYFSTSRFLFKNFVTFFYKGKKEAREVGAKAVERSDKLILNALSGSLAKIAIREGIKYNFNDSDGEENITTELIKVHSQSKSFIYMAAAILSYARAFIYKLAVKNKGRFLYSDTDSLHLAGFDIPNDIHISDKIGEFKIEHTFTAVSYYKQKAYIMYENNSYKLTIAGLSRKYKEYIEDVTTELQNETLWVPEDKTRTSTFNKYFSTMTLKEYRASLFPDFEKYIYDTAKNPKELFDKLNDIDIPNGETVCNDWKCQNVIKWMKLNR